MNMCQLSVDEDIIHCGLNLHSGDQPNLESKPKACSVRFIFKYPV